MQDRFELLLSELAAKPEFRAALSDFFQLLDWAEHRGVPAGKHAAETKDPQVKEHKVEKHEQGEHKDKHKETEIKETKHKATSTKEDAEMLLKDCKTLAERMASGHSLDPLDQAFRDFGTHLQGNEEIKGYFRHLRDFMLKAVESPEYFTTQQHKDELQRLLDEGDRLMDKNRENPYLKAVSRELREFKRALNNDPVTKKLKENLQQISNDFFVDENGNTRPNLDNINMFRKLVVPLLAEQINHFPLPAIEQYDDKMAFGVEGVTLRGKRLLPDRIDVDVKASMPLARDVPTITTMILNIKDFGIEVDDAKFWYEHYTFPKMTDQGVLNLAINGMDILMEITNAPEDSNHFFKLNRAVCKIDSVKYDITDAKHETAYKMMKPVLQPVIKTQIQHAIEDKFTAFLNMLDHQLIKRRSQVKQMREESAAVAKKAQQDVNSRIEREATTRQIQPYDDTVVTSQHHHGDPNHHNQTTKVKEHKHGEPGDHTVEKTKVKKHKMGEPHPETKVETKENKKHDGVVEPGHTETKVKEQHQEPGHPHHKVETTTTTKEKSDRVHSNRAPKVQ
jgi:hypothetical protein